MIDKGDTPSIQCNERQGALVYEKGDWLYIFFIDFYIPALTPRINGTETSLHLSEHIILLAVTYI
jgi:hypothetical protein